MNTISRFELLDDGRIRLGSHALRAFIAETPDADGDRYTVEVTADSDQRHGQHLPPHELGAIRPSDLPNGFYLLMERLEKGRPVFRNIHFLTARKQQDRLRLSLVVSFDHSDWHLPVALSAFAEEYASALSASGSLETSSQLTETGVDVVCSTTVAPDAALYTEYKAVAEQCLRTYRACIAAGYTGAKKIARQPVSATANSDSTGPKWWFRYVVVPVLGSGAFAAIVVALLALAK